MDAHAREFAFAAVVFGLTGFAGYWFQNAGLVRCLDRQYVSLKREHAGFAQKHERLGRVAHDHTHNGVIDSIGRSQRIDIDPRIRQRLTHARKCAGTICKENCQLSGGFNGELGMCIHAACKLTLGSGSDNLGKSRKRRNIERLNILEHQINGLGAFAFNVDYWVFGILAKETESNFIVR